MIPKSGTGFRKRSCSSKRAWSRKVETGFRIRSCSNKEHVCTPARTIATLPLLHYPPKSGRSNLGNREETRAMVRMLMAGMFAAVALSSSAQAASNPDCLKTCIEQQTKCETPCVSARAECRKPCGIDLRCRNACRTAYKSCVEPCRAAYKTCLVGCGR